jgi:hypothetical protein
MLTECQENEGFLKAVNAKGKSFVAESLFMVLIFQQQKMMCYSLWYLITQ